jgi:hypothetical protein
MRLTSPHFSWIQKNPSRIFQSCRQLSGITINIHAPTGHGTLPWMRLSANFNMTPHLISIDICTQSNWMLWTSINYVWNHLSILTSTVFQSPTLKISSMMETFHWIFSDGDSFLAWLSMPSLWTSQVLSWLLLGSILHIEIRELVLVCHVICLNVEIITDLNAWRLFSWSSMIQITVIKSINNFDLNMGSSLPYAYN